MTEDEIKLVLGKWAEERTALHVVLRSVSCTLGLDCIAIGFNSRSIGFESSGEFDMFEIFISGFDFDYREPAPGDAVSSVAGKRTYSSGLMGRKDTGEILAVMEIAKTSAVN